MSEFTIYTSNYCGYCTQAKRYLSDLGYKYEEIDLSQNHSLREELSEKGQVPALRLDMTAAFRRTGFIEWKDHEKGKVRSDPRVHGDIVLARKDIKTSYHLSATIDDHLQGITLVTRGEDLAGVTDIHRLLQEILNLNEPEYLHHKILKDKGGKKLSKRSSSTSIQSLRAAGYKQTEIINMIKSML